jgi:hypothetical protein
VKNSIAPAATVGLKSVSVLGTEILVVIAPPWNGRDVYQFEEKYYFEHPSFIDKTKVSTDPSNGFAVSYRGWGALRLVTITVQLNDGTSHSYYFDMVKALGW